MERAKEKAGRADTSIVGGCKVPWDVAGDWLCWIKCNARYDRLVERVGGVTDGRPPFSIVPHSFAAYLRPARSAVEVDEEEEEDDSW